MGLKEDAFGCLGVRNFLHYTRGDEVVEEVARGVRADYTLRMQHEGTLSDTPQELPFAAALGAVVSDTRTKGGQMPS